MTFELHLPTLVVALVLVNGIAGGSVLYVGWQRPAATGLRLWGGALLLNALQPLAFALRFYGPVAMSIFMANVTGVLVITLLWDAVARFRGHGARRPGLGGIIGFPAAAGIIGVLLRGSEHPRNAVTTLVLVVVSTLVLVAVVRSDEVPRRRTRGQLLMAAGGLLFAGLLGWRLVRVIAAQVTLAPADMTNNIQAVTYLVMLGCLLMQTIGFVLWHQEVAASQLHELATRDPLTGSLNRRALLDACAKLLVDVARHPRPVAMLLIDVDHFKAVNDRHGHRAGDAVLRVVADRLRHNARDIDRLARFGGEEFVLLADDADRTAALQLAERLRTAIAGTPVVFEDHTIPVTVSIGVHAMAHSRSPSLDALLSACDRALYRAKANGRNRVEAAA